MRGKPSTRECGDLAITAAEGGIGYWAVIDTYRPSRWDALEVADDFVFYSIVDGDREFEAIHVTPALILRGVRLMTGAGWLRIDADMELGELDAAEADAIIQYGAFGELVYS